ncbi:hypothetical protein [Pseudomonas sp.]|uniref:hypothetical protein n=1 Tax=Pseudomonas sp. TaxID=306 RepID=UPI003A97A4A6
MAGRSDDDRIGICQEWVSGIDKVVAQVEPNQLPAAIFQQTDEHACVVLFVQQGCRYMGQENRIRACYLHCCLKYVNREPMNSTWLPERLQIEEGDSAMASRIIKQATEAKAEIMLEHFIDQVATPKKLKGQAEGKACNRAMVSG